jgi:hypothetical protein
MPSIFGDEIMAQVTVHRGIIEGFRGSYGSGLGYLIVSGKPIPCDNGQTVRSLEAAFGNAIGEGHTVNNEGGFIGQDIVFSYDDMGLMMEGFTPTEDFENRFGEVPEIGESTEVEVN